MRLSLNKRKPGNYSPIKRFREKPVGLKQERGVSTRLTRWYLPRVGLICCEMGALWKYLQLARKFPLKQARFAEKQRRKSHNPCVIAISLDSRIPGLGNKSHSGIARKIAFLISEWPSHSVLIITEKALTETSANKGEHTHTETRTHAHTHTGASPGEGEKCPRGILNSSRSARCGNKYGLMYHQLMKLF